MPLLRLNRFAMATTLVCAGLTGGQGAWAQTQPEAGKTEHSPKVHQALCKAPAYEAGGTGSCVGSVVSEAGETELALPDKQGGREDLPKEIGALQSTSNRDITNRAKRCVGSQGQIVCALMPLIDLHILQKEDLQDHFQGLADLEVLTTSNLSYAF